MALVRYINSDPLKAGIVRDLTELDSYRWTSLATLIGKQNNKWQQTAPILRRFASNIHQARQKYRNFLSAGLGEEVDLSGGGLTRSYGAWDSVNLLRSEHEQRIGDERILGDGEFVDEMVTLDKVGLSVNSVNRRAGWDIDRIAGVVCQHFDVGAGELKRKVRRNDVSSAKSVLAHLAYHECNFKVFEIAKYLGVTSATVSKLKQGGQEYCADRHFELNSYTKVNQ